MKRLIITGPVLGVLVAPGAAEANTHTYVPCQWGAGGAWKAKPKRCNFGGQIHADQVPIRNMRWRRWGGRTACGRGTFFYNSGYRALARFCAYARRRWEGSAYVYTRLRGVVGSGCWLYPTRGCDPPGRRVHFRKGLLYEEA